MKQMSNLFKIQFKTCSSGSCIFLKYNIYTEINIMMVFFLIIVVVNIHVYTHIYKYHELSHNYGEKLHLISKKNDFLIDRTQS